MDSKEKVLQKAKNLFEKLKTDPKRPLFSEKKKKKKEKRKTAAKKIKKIDLRQGSFAAEADKYF